MKRRDKAVKTQRRKTLKRRNAPKTTPGRSSLVAGKETNVARLTRELEEALQQQAATGEVLSIIRRSPADAQPVFDAIVQSAARLCDAIFSVVYLYDGDRLRIAATQNFTPEATSKLQQRQELKRPDRSHVGGRAILDRAIVHVHDVLADPEYSRELALAGGWRAVLAVPLLRDGIPVGALTVGKTEPMPFSDRQIQLLNTFADQALIAIENVRLFETEQQRTRQLSESLEQQTATSEVLKVISSSPGELEPVFEAMLENAVRICSAKFGILYLSEGDVFRIGALHGVPPAYAEVRRREPIIHLRPGTAITRASASKQPVQIADVQAEAAYHSGDPSRADFLNLTGARTVVVVPMLKDDQVVGVISIYRQEVRPFTDKQIELVKNFAAQAVIAIENTRLLNELRQRTDDLSESLEQQTATSEVLKVISSSPGDLEPVFNAMLENATRICEAKFGAFYRYDGNEFHLGALLGAPPAFTEFQRQRGAFKPPPGTPLDRLLRTKEVIRTADDSASEIPSPSARLAGAKSHIAVPMFKDDELAGAIVIYRQEVRPFTDKQVELVQNFAAQAVIAIENTRLLNELRESLQQQTATSEVLSAISSSPGGLEPVFQTLLENATHICEARFGNLLLYENENDAFRMAAMHGAPPEFAAKRGREPIIHPNPKNPLFRVAKTRQLVHIIDLRIDEAYIDGDLPTRAFVELAGTHTIVVVPMLKDDKLIGAIGIYRQEVRPFTDKQIELLKNFAAQAVIAIENTRLLSELRELLQQQTATADVLKVISSSPGDLKPVFEAMLENAVRLCAAKFGSLVLFEGNAYRRVALHNAPAVFVETQAREPVRPLAASPTLSGLAETRQTICYADILAEQPEEAIARLGGARTVMAVPMLKDDRAVGAISIYRQEVRPFTDKQMEVLRNFAAQAVIAIENTRLLSELRESLEQQTATSEVLKIISSSPGELEPVFNAMLENAVKICGAKFGMLYRSEDDSSFRTVAMHDVPRAFSDRRGRNPVVFPPAGKGTPLGRIMRTRQVAHIADIRTEPGYSDSPPLKDLADLGGARTLVAVPMLKDNELVGAIVIYRQEVRPFNDKQIELLTNFAAQAVIAIENARLLNELRQRTADLSKSLEDLRTTQDRLVQTQKLASLGQLTAGIAHEIKNPLNFVNNFSVVSSELIDELRDTLKGPFDDKARAEINELTDTLRGNLDKVVQHGKRADAIVKNMLLHSREGSGEHRLADINAIVEESLNLAYHGARAEKQGFNITLQRSFDPAAGEVDVFPQDITRVLLNLISNGFYAATRRRAETNGGDYEPTLAATTKNLGDRVEITIRDNGTGIPSDVKEKMFNPFFTTKPAGEGTGLGLSISHDIVVKQHGGSIEVDTQPGGFTEVKIILPRAAVFLAESRGGV